MNATEKLEELLKECGARHAITKRNGRNTLAYAEWEHPATSDQNSYYIACAAQYGDILMCHLYLTPEQAIQATLGPAIVRCRDCKHAHKMANGRLVCTLRALMMHETTAEAFCSDGVRRTNEQR